MQSKLIGALALLACSLSLQAEETNENVLAELKALRQQVSQLEARLDALEGTTPAEANDKGWFDTMRVELKKAEVRASGAWTSPASWTNLEKGLSEDEVIALLGEPSFKKFSVRKDTDEIFHYRGDLEGKGKTLEGEVRFYKGKASRFSAPEFSGSNGKP